MLVQFGLHLEQDAQGEEIERGGQQKAVLRHRRAHHAGIPQLALVLVVVLFASVPAFLQPA